MPVVERYSVPRIDQAPIPGVQRTGAPSEAALGGEIGGTLEQAGSQVVSQSYRIAEEAKLQADQIGALKAESDLAGKVTDYLYNPQQGALTKTGSNAFSLPEDAQDWWTKTSGEIRATLATDRQRLAYDRAAKGRQLEFQADVMHHVANQTKLYAQDTMTGAVQNFQAEAVTHASEPPRVELSIARQQAAIMDGSKGLPPEEVKRRVDLAASQTYAGVINALIAKGQDQQAQATFDQVKDKLGEQLPAVEHAVREHSMLGEAQRQADAIMVTQPATVQDAVDAADKIQDPEVRKLATAQIRQSFAIKKQAAAEQVEADMTTAGNLIDKNPAGGLTQVQRLPMWQTFSPNQKENLELYAKRTQVGKVETDWGQYYTLMSLASAPDTQDAFARTNLMQYRAALGDTEFKQLTEVQVALRKKETPTVAGLLAGPARRAEIIHNTFIGLGIDPTPNEKTPKAQRDQYTAFNRAVDDWENGEVKRTGKPVTYDDLRAEVDRLVVKGTTPGTSWFGLVPTQTPKYLFETGPTDALVLKPSDIPAVDLQAIQATLKRQNIPVTDKAIMDTFLAATRGVKPSVPPVLPAPALQPMTPIKSH